MTAVRVKTSIRLTLAERALFRKAGTLAGLPWQGYMRSRAVEAARRDIEEASRRLPQPETDPRQASFGTLLAKADD